VPTPRQRPSIPLTGWIKTGTGRIVREDKQVYLDVGVTNVPPNFGTGLGFNLAGDGVSTSARAKLKGR